LTWSNLRGIIFLINENREANVISVYK